MKALATNDYVFAVNEAVNNKIMHYAEVIMTEASAAAAEARVIQFPKGDYLVVKGEAKTSDELNSTLTATAFGQVLSEATNLCLRGCAKCNG